MNNPIPQALPGFDGCETDAPTKAELPPFKYLEIEVTRNQSSVVFIKVPRDFDVKKIQHSRGMNSILVKACKETLSDGDWDDFGWELEIECNSIKEVSESVATTYQVHEVK